MNELRDVMGFKVIEGYEELFYTLVQAYEQATIGKGKVRHAKNGAAFEDQPLFTIAREHGLAFLTGQAAKKLSEIYSFLDDEADDTRYEKAYNELSGAIVYTAAAMMRIAEMEREQKNTDTEVKPPFPPPVPDTREVGVYPFSPPSRLIEARLSKTRPNARTQS